MNIDMDVIPHLPEDRVTDLQRSDPASPARVLVPLLTGIAIATMVIVGLATPLAALAKGCVAG